MAYRRGDNDRPEVLGHGFIEATTWGEGMSGDHNMYQKPRSYLDKQEPVARADRIIDDLAELFDKDRIREADSGDALIRLHEAIAVVEEARELYNKQPTKIFGPGLEELLNSAGFYKKREWVGLTIHEAIDFYDKYTDRAELINAIDKFLEEKNT
jgi:hypothetical protein